MRTISDHWEGAEEDGDLSPQVKDATEAAWVKAAELFKMYPQASEETIWELYEDWWVDHWKEFVKP